MSSPETFRRSVRDKSERVETWHEQDACITVGQLH
jgi:hypothetical protein